MRWTRSGPRRMRPRNRGRRPSRLAEPVIGPATSGRTRWLAPQGDGTALMRSSCTLLTPKPRRRDIGAVADRFELEPHHRLDHPFAPGEGAEAAVGRGDDPLAVADG